MFSRLFVWWSQQDSNSSQHLKHYELTLIKPLKYGRFLHWYQLSSIKNNVNCIQNCIHFGLPAGRIAGVPSTHIFRQKNDALPRTRKSIRGKSQLAFMKRYCRARPREAHFTEKMIPFFRYFVKLLHHNFQMVNAIHSIAGVTADHDHFFILEYNFAPGRNI